MDKVTARVAAQYTAYVYPEAFSDLDVRVEAGHVDFGDPSYFGPMFWPEGRTTAPKILVAGCGTVQASVIAYRNPDSQVVGVDISDASLGHQRFLRERFGLTNLELYQGDLRDVGKLQETFDLVVSTGVLHHMADPLEGLAALKTVLAPDGAMFIMVYGAVGRMGVYLMQDVFRRMGLTQSADDVAFARYVLGVLPPEHPVQAFNQRALDLGYDAGVVDTFLHPQDRAYTVPQVLEWIESAGLAFQSWMEPANYEPHAYLPQPLIDRIAPLPDQERWAAVEGVLGASIKHAFVLRHPERAHRLPFDGDEIFAYRPRRYPDAMLEQREGQFVMVRNGVAFLVNETEAAVFSWCDGARTMGDMVGDPIFAGFDVAARRVFLRECLRRMWRLGVMMFQRDEG
ncbi:class I SAM-dependent methyltransferase [Caulobacter sp.]|uniref:class I SAM-dependent methyltransferase n=1 Tax=Caulobacter sp. TaxID=78 RepID=UPI002B49252B|nr:methyltransferase domain-containing protein [Caulobacter sp.]HJV40651.1 methyltransferase domain-containing protein [Caulobacter sp.]